jgi:L-iditol 2-dehydrogenase
MSLFCDSGCDRFSGMKSLVLTGIRKIEIAEKPAPALRHPTDVLLKITRVGICGSDIHYYTQGRIGDQIVDFHIPSAMSAAQS